MTVDRLRSSATRLGASLGAVAIAISVVTLIVVVATITYQFFDALEWMED